MGLLDFLGGAGAGITEATASQRKNNMDLLDMAIKARDPVATQKYAMALGSPVDFGGQFQRQNAMDAAQLQGEQAHTGLYQAQASDIPAGRAYNYRELAERAREANQTNTTTSRGLDLQAQNNALAARLGWAHVGIDGARLNQDARQFGVTSDLERQRIGLMDMAHVDAEAERAARITAGRPPDPGNIISWTVNGPDGKASFDATMDAYNKRVSDAILANTSRLRAQRPGPTNPVAQSLMPQGSGGTSAYAPMIDNAGRRFNVDPVLLQLMMGQESGGDPNATSPVGAHGLMQLMPGTAHDLGVNPNVPRQNIEGGAKYLRSLLDQFHGNVQQALAAYNAGPGAVQQYHGVPPYAETQDYVQRILGGYHGSGYLPTQAQPAPYARPHANPATYGFPPAYQQMGPGPAAPPAAPPGWRDSAHAVLSRWTGNDEPKRGGK